MPAQSHLVQIKIPEQILHQHVYKLQSIQEVFRPNSLFSHCDNVFYYDVFLCPLLVVTVKTSEN